MIIILEVLNTYQCGAVLVWQYKDVKVSVFDSDEILW